MVGVVVKPEPATIQELRSNATPPPTAGARCPSRERALASQHTGAFPALLQRLGQRYV